MSTNSFLLGAQLSVMQLDLKMEQYIYQRNSDGIGIIDFKRTWEKLLLAACAIVTTENLADVSVISSRSTCQ